MRIAYKIALLIVCTIATLLLHRLNAQAEVEGAYLDSMRNVLQQTTDPVLRLPLLKDLSTLYWQQPEEVTYLEEMIDLSLKLDSFDLVYAGMAGLCRHYFNEENPDSLIFWKNQLDSICHQRSETPNAYFRVGNLLCMYYHGKQNYELAISEAFNMLNEARQRQDDFGLMIANQSLGYAYWGIGRNADAANVYREGLTYLDSLNVSPTYEMQYLSEMILPFLQDNILDESEQILNRYANLYKSVKAVFEEKGLLFPVVWHQWLIDSYFAELYIKKGQLDKAKTSIEKAAQSADVSDEEEMKFQYYRIKSIFYFRVKDYNTALDAINKVLQVDKQPVLLKLKIDILRANGRKAEAMALYDELFVLNAKISDEAFGRQIQQLRTLNDLSDQEKQTFELHRQNEQLAMRQQLLFIVMAVVVVLLALLYLLIRIYRRTSKLKNALLHEKNSLVKSEKQLRIAKEKAEEANQLKTAFISNISHEVRTPLNAIVGFSRLMADSTYLDEEKKGFTEIISMNSELLLKLVNDVLDLSRLEAGKVKLTLKTCDLTICCREAIDEMKHNVAPSVKVIPPPSSIPYLLDTDAYWLKQILVNLLRNAAKFTKEGEISLSFEINEKNRQVCLKVMDTGCGIPAENQSKIFGHFEKLDEFVQGTGLGLPICTEIARLFKGRIYLDTDYTTGACFVFIHPIGLLKE